MMPLTRVVKHLVIINVLVFFAVYFVLVNIPATNPVLSFLQNARYWLAMHFPASVDFRPFQIVTHMFMHGNLSHLFFNMFALWMFGSALERTMGQRRFLMYYFICGLGAVLLHTAVWYLEFNQLSPMARQAFLQTPHMVVGASGAIFGLLAGYAMYYPNNQIMLLIPPIPIKAKYFVLIYGALELYLGVSRPDSQVAHFAHLGGALIGYLLLKFRTNF